MPLRPVVSKQLIMFSALLGALTAVALLASPRSALAFPPAGTDNLPASGQVSVTSLLGQETIPLTGTVTIQRGAAQLQGGVEVVPAEIIALNLQGNSLTGPVTVAESVSLASMGELRALQPSSSYPASSLFDVYATITVPAAPSPSVTLHNNAPLHVVATTNLYNWPPASTTYSAAPNPCVPLLPALPKSICITSLSLTISGGVGGVTRLSEIGASAATERAPSRSDREAGIGIAVAGALTAAGGVWWARRSLDARR